MDKTSLVYISIFIMAGAFLFLLAGYNSFMATEKTENWIPKQAVIETSRLESGNGVHLDMTARILGTSEVVPVDLVYGTYISQQDYRDFAEKYSAGTKTIIYHNPEDIKDAVLLRPGKVNPFAYLWLSLAILLVVIEIAILKKHNKSNEL